MAIELEEGIKKLPNYNKDTLFVYDGITFPAPLIKQKPDSIKLQKFLEIMKAMADHDIELTKDSVKIGALVYEKNQDAFSNSFLNYYNKVGNVNCYELLLKQSMQDKIESVQKELSEIFEAKFRGRVPQIVHAMAIASILYDISPQDIVDNFDVQSIRSAKQHVSPVEATVLMIGAKNISSKAIFDSDVAKYAVKCYCYYLKGKGDCYKNAGDFIASHPQTKEKLLKKIAKKADELEINENSTVESIEVQFGNMSSASEVQKIEKAYKACGFKFRNCVFDLKFSNTTYDRYRMEILRPGDTRMVYLGDFTHCCQRLHDAGESAMMHGLLNPKAGFWCMTDERTGRVVAQAEIWELSDTEDSLVFDNIEFANDADISLYRKAIGAWLQNSPYKNVYMGCGYNEIYSSGYFETVGGLTPSVTPYEIYVISHEKESEAPVFNSEEEAASALENGTVTYFDYVYCDSEFSSVIMKQNDAVVPYFTVDDLAELSEINRDDNLPRSLDLYYPSEEEECEEDYAEEYES